MNRKVIIVDSNNSQKIELEGNYTTFGDILAAARNAGMNTDNKDWKDGISRAEYTSASDPNAVLPTNMEFRGVTTNNMVFRVTTTSKQISSGISRVEIYAIIKDNNLAEAIKEEFGKNYTNCSTAALEEFVNDNLDSEENSVVAPVCSPCDVADAIANMLTSLPDQLYNTVMDKVNKVKNFNLSDADINALFD